MGHMNSTIVSSINATSPTHSRRFWKVTDVIKWFNEKMVVSGVYNWIIDNLGMITNVSAAILFLSYFLWASHYKRGIKSEDSAGDCPVSVKTSQPLIPVPTKPQMIQPSAEAVPGNASDSVESSSCQAVAKHISERRLKKKLLTLPSGPEMKLQDESLDNEYNNNIATGVSPKKAWNAVLEERVLLDATNEMTIGDFRNYIQNRRALEVEFVKIPRNKQETIVVLGTEKKNRYSNVIPNENTRVKLPELDKLEEPFYINGNYVSGWDGNDKTYIATQGPLNDTIDDFWDMVWNLNCKTIIMLTDIYEYWNKKCAEYFPSGNGYIGSSNVVKFTTYSVSVVSFAAYNGYELRIFKMQKGEEIKMVRHFWYKSWVDQDLPKILSPIIYFAWHMEAMYHQGSPVWEAVNQADESSDYEIAAKKQAPIVVHCSAGLGRTGIYIGTCNGMNEIISKKKIDVLKLFAKLRLSRGNMIPNFDQYYYLHQVLEQFEVLYREGKLIIPEPIQ